LLCRVCNASCNDPALAVLRPARDHAEKKTAHASEQERPDVVKRRQAWFDRQLDLDPDRLVFIDAPTWPAAMAGRLADSVCP
jgi:hypothetical protein